MGAMGDNRVLKGGMNQYAAAAPNNIQLPIHQDTENSVASDLLLNSVDLNSDRLVACMLGSDGDIRSVQVSATDAEIFGQVVWLDANNKTTVDGFDYPDTAKVVVGPFITARYVTTSSVAPAIGDRVVLSTSKGKVWKAPLIDSDDEFAAGTSFANWIVVAKRTAEEEVDLLLQ